MIEKIVRKIGESDLILETGKFAKQAGGAVTVQYGGTVVLVTAVMSREPGEGRDFLPLTVEYKEKTYAAGKIPGGFFKREGRPSEQEILIARLIDRSIRPLFLPGMTNAVQIVAIVLSSDGENDPDVLAIIGASAALTISDIPFFGPIGAIKVGRVSDNFILNPTYAQVERSDLELVVVGDNTGILMVEAGAREVPENVIIDSMRFGNSVFSELINMQKELAAKCAKKKAEVECRVINHNLYTKVRDISLPKLVTLSEITSKEDRQETLNLIAGELIKEFVTEGSGISELDVRMALDKVEKEYLRDLILEKNMRPDQRKFDEIREINCEIAVLPRTHGSGLFSRGQTQSLAVTTLGTSADEQRIDALEEESTKTFMLHYNFPPFSVGEVRPIRGPGRREIGHGALAERALKSIMPSKEEFPYTVRVVSEILESNGSSSMATVCAATLSLMDAGVPIIQPVSGIAMGLVKKGEKVAVLTDIAGLEDHYGDMDFKVTGTENGVTALQLDVKIREGIDFNNLANALAQAKTARLFILNKMLTVIAKPRADISEYAPRIITIRVQPDKIKDIIGPSGKIIKKIIEQTGVTIDIEDDGRVNIASVSSEASQKAMDIINKIVEDVEVGKTYMGKVKRILNFGAFCEILPNKEGLIHISELDDKYVSKVEDVVKIGDEVLVKVIEIDEQGRVNLSRKQAIKEKGKNPPNKLAD
ncbi:MAG: polyribonucleotide nucleotidyltransferase [Candidatus Omnitrophota bacterium]